MLAFITTCSLLPTRVHTRTHTPQYEKPHIQYTDILPALFNNYFKGDDVPG